MAKGFKVADAFVEVHLDDSAAKREVGQIPQRIGSETDRAGTDVGRRMGQSIGKGLGPEADRAGRDGGSKLSQGMQMAFIRSSPLIAAAIGGAMAAGAPAAIAGATLAFGGIGIVAAAQSERVQNAWMGAWEDISSGTQADAAVMQDSLVRMAGAVSAGFEQLRPALQDIFTAVAPQLEQFTDSLMQAANNAMPGLVSAVQQAGPVMDGLGSLVESVGTGLSDFFSAIADHAQAAGGAFSEIGASVGQLLPILGQLLGVGAEVAQTFLPLLTGGLGALRTVLDAVGPALPSITAGIGGWKVGQMAAGWLGSAASAVGKVGDAMGGGEEGADGFSSALSLVGDNAESISEKAGPILGSAIAAVTFVMQSASDQTSEWATALLAGGNAAADARDQMADLSIWQQFIYGITNMNMELTETQAAAKDVKGAYNDMLDAMSPLQRAQTLASQAQADYNSKVSDFGKHSLQANEALQHLGEANAEVARQEDAVDEATRAAADSLADAATQMERQQEAADNLKAALGRLNGEQMSLADAEIAYQQSLDDITEQIDNIRKGTEGYAKTLDISTQAGRDNKKMLLELAGSTADAAQAYYDATGDYGGFVSRLQDGRQALIDDAIAMGASQEEAAALADSVLRIPTEFDIKGDLNADEVNAQVQGVLDKIKSVPPNTVINLGLLDNGTVDQLKALGVDLYTLDGKTWMVRVAADDQATGVIDEILVDMGLINGTPVNVDVSAPLSATTQASLTEIYNNLRAMLGLPPIEPHVDLPGLPPVATDLHGFAGDLDAVGTKNVQPTVGLNDQATPKIGGVMAGMNVLGQQRSFPTADLNDGALKGKLAAGMSSLGTLGAQRPAPTPSLNDGSLKAAIKAQMSSLQVLGSQRPTPTPGLNDGGIKGAIKGVMSALATLGAQHPTPTVTLIDNASGTARSIAAAINAIQSKTVTITTVNRSTTALAGGGPIGDALGGVTRAATGRVVGPGTSTSDSIRAVGPGGAPWRLSDGEWVVKASAVDALERAFGSSAMPTINSGRLPVGGDGGSAPSAVAARPINLTLNVYAGIGANGEDIGRTALRTIQQGLRKLDRENS